ncbi:MAG TPA: hypothetical protein PK961_09495 [bacterium]|nr:hypothetical protein [bacterium]
MVNKIFLSILFVLLLASFSFADSYDDDIGEPDQECSHFCHRLDECEVSCLDEYCLGYCLHDMPVYKFSCLELENCTDFTQCFCSFGGTQTGNDDDGGCGCNISHSETSSALTFFMLAVGLLALWLSSRTRKTKNN